MKKLTVFAIFGCLIFMAANLQSCKNDADDDTVTPEEFIADDAAFVDFTSWALGATEEGPDPSADLGGFAHGADDSTVVRTIYFKDGQDPVDGVYPVGTLIGKHVMNPDGTVAAAFGMAKRGNGFNSAAGDWEWFKLMTDGTLIERGGNVAGFEGCNGCHAGAADKDYVFTQK